MHLSTGLLPWLAATTVLAFPKESSSLAKGTWQRPGADDDRSPCPGLNTLANHGLIPRNGRNLDLPTIAAAAQKAMSVDPVMTEALFNGSLKLGLANKDGKTINLSNLDKHNAIEHDGSLSRADEISGDNTSFNQTKWDAFINRFNGSDTITFPAASDARVWSIANSKKKDGLFFKYGAAQKVFSCGETALYMGLLGYLDNDEIDIKQLQTFFEHERIPEGFTPSKKSLNGKAAVKLITELLKMGGEQLFFGIDPTEEQVSTLLFGSATPP